MRTCQYIFIVTGIFYYSSRKGENIAFLYQNFANFTNYG